MRPLAACLLLFTACEPKVPLECVDMCDAAATALNACLTEWEIAWDAAGYEDQADFIDACLTYSWELRTLEQAGELGSTSALCAERQRVLEEGGCEAYLSLNWGSAE